MTDNATPAEVETLTEQSAFAELLKWSRGDRPAWQRDALRRLVQQDALNTSDVEALLTICLDPNSPSEPLSEDHLSGHTAAGEAISIVRIEDPVGINALAAKQKLEFAKTGLTVIYGDNGSGKSGYVRVLKHACRTRDCGSKILRDVEDAGAKQQSAKIIFARNGIDDAFDWSPDVPGHPELPSVSIFDSRSANIHVEKTNAVAYIPRPMQVLEELASTCDLIKAKLDERLREITAKTPLAIKTPKLSLDTAAGAYVRGLTANTNLAQLAILVQLTDVERQRLATLEADLAQDPKRAAAKVTSQKTRLDESVTLLKKLVAASTANCFLERDTLKADWDASRNGSSGELARPVHPACRPGYQGCSSGTQS
jgi:energy-coupling factor transporter ATP-binding protein EcfA2